MTWRDELFHNPGLKLFSIGLASLLWYAVNGRHSYSSAAALPDDERIVKDYVRIPITVMQPATEGNTFRVRPGEVSVQVSGTQAVLQELRGSDLEVFVNLTDIGDRPVSSRRVKVLAPAEIRVLKVEPALVHVERLNFHSIFPTNSVTNP